jgi:uncharacterized protein (DUF58 family)
MNLQFEKILIKAKRAVFSENLGNNISPFKGEGYDFMELREYEIGDDIKNINWNISAKLQKLFVKVFHEQREYRINIVSLVNGSIEYGKKTEKKEMLAQLVAILSYSSVKQGDNFSNFILNENIELLNIPTKRMVTIHSTVEKLYNYNCLGKEIDINKLNYDLFYQLQKKSICFLVGDFLDVENLDLSLLSSKHDIYVIIIRDRVEENPSHLGYVNAKDPSSLESFSYSIDENAIAQYLKELKRNDHLLYAHLEALGIKYVKIYTDETPMGKLRKLF